MFRVISLHVIKCYDWNPMQSVSFSAVTGPDLDTLPGFPGWSRLVKSHCIIPKEDTVELHFKEGSKHMY